MPVIATGDGQSGHATRRRNRVGSCTATIPTHNDPTAVRSASIMAAATSWLCQAVNTHDVDGLYTAVRGVTGGLCDPKLVSRGRARDGR